MGCAIRNVAKANKRSVPRKLDPRELAQAIWPRRSASQRGRQLHCHEMMPESQPLPRAARGPVALELVPLTLTRWRQEHAQKKLCLAVKRREGMTLSGGTGLAGRVEH